MVKDGISEEAIKRNELSKTLGDVLITVQGLQFRPENPDYVNSSSAHELEALAKGFKVETDISLIGTTKFDPVKQGDFYGVKGLVIKAIIEFMDRLVPQDVFDVEG